MGVLNQALRLLLVSSAVVGGRAVSRDCAASGPATHYKNSLSVAMGRCDKTDDRDFKDEDFDLLSKSFVEAYDSVGASAEAEYCLAFEDIEVVDSSRRRLEDANDDAIDASTIGELFASCTESTGGEYCFFFLVVFQCYFCSDPSLIGDDASRLLETQGLSEVEVKDLRPTKNDFVEKFREILSEKGICLESLDPLGAVEVEAPNAAASFDQLAMSLRSLVAALVAFAVLL